MTPTAPAELVAVNTPDAPEAIGPYSQGVRVGDLVFVSGQLPIDPVTGDVVTGDIGAELTQALHNAEAILLAAQSSLDLVVKTTVLTTSLADFAAINKAYGAIFTGTVKPARAAYEVSALPRGARIEVELVAACRPVDSDQPSSTA